MLSISNEQIKQVIDDAQKNGFRVGIRDVAYVILCKSFEDISVAYRCLFGAEKDYNPASAFSYDATGAIAFVRNYIENSFTYSSNKKKRPNIGDLTFEENKSEIIKLIKSTREALANGEIEAKDALKIEADLRIKLNDKFQVKEEVKDQYVIVSTKFNRICERCGTEIYVPTKEDLMKTYGLVEK